MNEIAISPILLLELSSVYIVIDTISKSLYTPLSNYVNVTNPESVYSLRVVWSTDFQLFYAITYPVEFLG